MESTFTTPILFCIFNRPELTARVFDSIRQRRPNSLLIASDGPREGVPSDRQNVHLCREIVRKVDWPCDVKHRFLTENLGCKHAMSQAISWAFESTESLVILEDDCLPDPSFFEFCEKLLAKYHDAPEVMMISGNNFQPSPRTEFSYYFSRWAHIWGWATWKRAWQKFDVNVSSWPELRDRHSLSSVFTDPFELEYWSKTLDAQHAGQIDTWDFPWAYALWANRGLSILPEINLVKNIGFGPDATHTTDPESRLSKMPVGSIVEMKHPADVSVHESADRYTWEHIFLPTIASAPVERVGWQSKLKKLKKLKSIRNWISKLSKVA